MGKGGREHCPHPSSTPYFAVLCFDEKQLLMPESLSLLLEMSISLSTAHRDLPSPTISSAAELLTCAASNSQNIYSRFSIAETEMISTHYFTTQLHVLFPISWMPHWPGSLTEFCHMNWDRNSSIHVELSYNQLCDGSQPRLIKLIFQSTVGIRL